jgi:hypothetical protein
MIVLDLGGVILAVLIGAFPAWMIWRGSQQLREDSELLRSDVARLRAENRRLRRGLDAITRRTIEEASVDPALKDFSIVILDEADKLREDLPDEPR